MRTPSGAIAVIIRNHPEVSEALVRWPNGQEARFTYKNLRHLPGAA